VDVAQPGRAISRDISRGEAVEAEIDSFITKRPNDRVARGEGERLAEEAWKASERREEARRLAEVEHARLGVASALGDRLRGAFRGARSHSRRPGRHRSNPTERSSVA
jgi:hypothetical protein